jgi:hypothetical protein
MNFREKKKSSSDPNSTKQAIANGTKKSDEIQDLEKGIGDAINDETEKIIDELENTEFFDMGESTETNYVGHLISFLSTPLVKFIYFQV